MGGKGFLRKPRPPDLASSLTQIERKKENRELAGYISSMPVIFCELLWGWGNIRTPQVT